MSLVAAQIFVETQDAEAVELTVATALAEWTRDVGELPVNAEGVPLPSPDRRVVLLPPVDGWLTVIEENGRLDRGLARTLAARLGVTVLAAELDGHFLSANFLSLSPGADEEEWSAGERLDDERMPIYGDAEAELFEALVARGVPPGVIAVDWEEHVDARAPAAEGARIRGEAGVEGLEKTIVPFASFAAADVVPGPRVRPDLWVAGPDGEARVVEGRRVTGRWHEAAVASLAAVEERQLERILGTLAWTTEDERLPRVEFRYEGAEEDEGFVEALAEARTARPRLAAWLETEWLSARGLVRALVAVTERLLPAFEVGRTCGDRVEFRHEAHPNASYFVRLPELWEAYREEPEALDRLCALMLIQAREEGAEPPCYDEARLVPLLLGEGTPGLEALATRPFTGTVWAAVGVDSGRCVQPLTRAALAEAGVGFDDALDRAVSLVELATERHDEFVLYEQPEGQTMYAEFPDVSTAARILSPAVLGHLAQQLGDECCVAVPARDVLLAAEGTPEARRWLVREVVARFASASLPLTRMVWSVQNGELVEEGLASLRGLEAGEP
jgi:hypothetical protein